MAKADRGTKRQCQKCGTKYYDLNRDPVACPNCGTPFVLEAVVAANDEPEAVVEEAAVEEVETDTAAKEAGAEVVPMEDAEESDTSDDDTEDEENLPDVDEIEDIGGEVDNSFIEDDDEDDNNIGIDVDTDDDED